MSSRSQRAAGRSGHADRASIGDGSPRPCQFRRYLRASIIHLDGLFACVYVGSELVGLCDRDPAARRARGLQQISGLPRVAGRDAAQTTRRLMVLSTCPSDRAPSSIKRVREVLAQTCGYSRLSEDGKACDAQRDSGSLKARTTSRSCLRRVSRVRPIRATGRPRSAWMADRQRHAANADPTRDAVIDSRPHHVASSPRSRTCRHDRQCVGADARSGAHVMSTWSRKISRAGGYQYPAGRIATRSRQLTTR
jgi:hypothetical protein